MYKVLPHDKLLVPNNQDYNIDPNTYDGDDDIPPLEHGDDYIDMRYSDDETYDPANPDHDDYF